MSDYEPWNEQRARQVITAHFETACVGTAGVETGSATLPILHALQGVFGCVPHQAVPIMASALNVSRAEMHGIVTFYHDFRRTPPGRHLLQVCRAEACQAVGGNAIGDHIRKSLGADWHETSANGAVTIEPVFCLGLCASGPAALLDGYPMGRLDAARVDGMLEALA